MIPQKINKEEDFLKTKYHLHRQMKKKYKFKKRYQNIIIYLKLLYAN